MKVVNDLFVMESDERDRKAQLGGAQGRSSVP